MDIANPIYDVVFRYLMNDNRVASTIISAIIDMQVKTLEFRSTEKTAVIEHLPLTVFRLDFAADVLTEEGEQKKILIEIQKAKYSRDIMRFRRYIGEEYQNRENCIVTQTPQGESVSAIPLITIYFLGYTLNHTKAPVIRVRRGYTDAVSGKEIEKPEEFIESLTHDSHIIQIPYLSKKRKSDLLALLKVFDQSSQIHDGKGHTLRIDETAYPEKYRKVIRRLQKAIAKPEIRETMEIEDEFLEDLKSKERIILEEKEKAANALAGKEKERAEKEKERAEKEKERAEKENALAEKENALAEKENALAEKEKERAAKENALAELQRLQKLLEQKK
ncbi:MAG: hypothetical protein GY757_58270 [bacterium]|nr:hypothetical protein [bacterium]